MAITKQAAFVDLAVLNALKEGGFLTCRKHPTDPLLIWNYSQRAQWEKQWTPTTMMCRGLITTPDGEIVARPFSKFFNAGEWISMGKEIPVEPFEVTEKLDGSLGILYRSTRGWEIATRGSFESPQAQRGTQLLDTLPATFEPNPGHTYLFEIIYPENRIVVNYGDRRGLILLAVIETTTGQELPLSHFADLPQAKRYDVTEFDAITTMGGDNEEGFVVRFQSGLRLKIKLDEYVRLHRLLTGVTPRKVWEVLSSGGSLEDFMKGVPEEFATWLKTTAGEMWDRYYNLVDLCEHDFTLIPEGISRKEQAAVAKRQKYPAVLFKMLDGKPWEPLIWKAIYPPPANAFRLDADAG